MEEELNWTHFMVNHSVEYVTSEGVHTNHIEGSWAGVKRKVPIRHRTVKFIQGHLYEFIWRRMNASNLWKALLRALNEVTYPEE